MTATETADGLFRCWTSCFKELGIGVVSCSLLCWRCSYPSQLGDPTLRALPLFSAAAGMMRGDPTGLNVSVAPLVGVLWSRLHCRCTPLTVLGEPTLNVLPIFSAAAGVVRGEPAELGTSGVCPFVAFSCANVEYRWPTLCWRCIPSMFGDPTPVGLPFTAAVVEATRADPARDTPESSRLIPFSCIGWYGLALNRLCTLFAKLLALPFCTGVADPIWSGSGLPVTSPATVAVL